MYRKIKPSNGKRVGEPQITQMKTTDYTDKMGQVTLEITLGLIGILLLLLASVQVFVWVNERLVLRQEDYEGSVEGRKQFGRVEAGKADKEVQVDESDTTRYKKLTILE